MWHSDCRGRSPVRRSSDDAVQPASPDVLEEKVAQMFTKVTQEAAK